jgi:hypothetical protein
MTDYDEYRKWKKRHLWAIGVTPPWVRWLPWYAAVLTGVTIVLLIAHIFPGPCQPGFGFN